MNITKKDVSKFQALYKKYFNKDIDDQEAFKQLTLLVRQMEIVYQPITGQQFADLLERDLGKKSKTTKKK